MLESSDFISLQDAGLPAEKILDLLKSVRSPFLTDNGREVLFDMMKEAGLFSKIDKDDAEKIGARNLMIYQLERMGILDRDIILEALKIALSRYPALREEKK